MVVELDNFSFEEGVFSAYQPEGITYDALAIDI